MRNLLTDVAGLRVGNAHDPVLASGVSVAVFDPPAVASIAILGGAAGVRDTALLEPEATVACIDAIVLSGGSAFGLDACGGAMAALANGGRGFCVAGVRVPIVPGAVIFDLAGPGAQPVTSGQPWWELGMRATQSAAADFALGTAGAGYGATTADVKGGLGSASARTQAGFTVAALAVVNAVGSPLIQGGPHFWACADERAGEFGGLVAPVRYDPLAGMPMKDAADVRANTTIAIVATDARLTKAEARRVAIMAHDGMARALRPAHAPMDGDVVFAAATGASGRVPDLVDLARIGEAAAHCLARAIARGVYEATSVAQATSPRAYRDRFPAPGGRPR